MRGFLAMEYHHLILNHSFVVFIEHDGLVGWKCAGIVSALNPRFFERFEQRVSGPAAALGAEEREGLMKKRGSFFIPREDITSVDFTPKPKWGMGPVPHSGRLYVRTRGGRARELILLGRQDGEAVRTALLAMAA